jgi:hypothetical protein
MIPQSHARIMLVIGFLLTIVGIVVLFLDREVASRIVLLTALACMVILNIFDR